MLAERAVATFGPRSRDDVAEAGTWTRASFGCHEDLLEEAVSLCRRTPTTAKAKIGFMDVVQWLLARLDHDGVRARVLRQWESTAPAQHHAITRFFLMPGTDLRRTIDDMAGGNMAPCLVTAMMRLVHLDDSVGEGPHNAATRIYAAGRASTWSWTASLTDEAHLSRQQLWNKYKSVLQRRQQSRVHGQRNFRCNRALFEKQVYVLDRRFDPDGEHSVVASDGPLALHRPDRAALEGGQEDPDEGVPSLQIPLAASAAGLDEDSTLARDYADAALQLFAFVSVPTKSGSVVLWIVFLVLAKSAKPSS